MSDEDARAVISRSADYDVPAEVAAMSQHLLDHDGRGTALIFLADEIAERRVDIPDEYAQQIYDLASPVISDDEWPPGFLPKSD